MSKTMVLMYIGLYLASCTMWLFIACRGVLLKGRSTFFIPGKGTDAT